MTLDDYLKKQIEEAAQKAGFEADSLPEYKISIPKQSGHGDLSTNIAFLLASQEKKNPREIAAAIIEQLDLDVQYIEKTEVAGAGFINFTFAADHLKNALKDILDKNEQYGRDNWGQEKKTQVEFVSANPTGPLTIGHGRQAVLGDTIARLLDATGHQVMREYYFNDAGRQMRVLGDSVRLRYNELLGDSIEFPDDYYQGEYIRQIAQKAVDKKGDSLKDSDELQYFTDLAEEAIFEDIKETLSRLGIVFDVFYNEKSLYETGKIDEVIERTVEEYGKVLKMLGKE